MSEVNVKKLDRQITARRRTTLHDARVCGVQLEKRLSS